MSRNTDSFFRHFSVVLAKEVIDALRDRRTLLRMLLPAVLMGPLILSALTGLIASMEERAEQREIYAVGIEQAPTLRNFLERQSYRIKDAPADYESQLRNTRLLEPVLLVGKDFEQLLQDGEAPTLEIVTDSANQRAAAGVGTLTRLLQGFGQERMRQGLALRGVSGTLLSPVQVDERDLASPQARATRLTGIVPVFIVMAVLYGALTAALDSTAGERERGSLEPLLLNPAPHMAIVLGKWGAVALLGMLVALLANLSFLPAQLLIRSDSLQAMFQFGWGEVLRCLLLQLPLAASMGALLMAVAIRSKTFKEAQAGSSVVMMAVSLTPLVTIMNPGAEAPWHYWVPGLGQNALMLLVLKGEALRWTQVLPSFIVGAAMTVAGLAYVARSMRGAVAR